VGAAQVVVGRLQLAVLQPDLYEAVTGCASSRFSMWTIVI